MSWITCEQALPEPPGTGMGREEEGLLAGCLGEFHYLFFHTRNSKERYQMIGSKGKQSMIGFCHFSTTQELVSLT